MYDFKLVENYRDNSILRNSFYEFTEKVFSGLNFKKWYESGFWTEKYIPHSLVKNNQIIANVSISKMDVMLNKKLIRGIQFGTVGTLSNYRNQGFSIYLMQYVLNKYRAESNLFFLYANDSVINFYPKFGFERKMESKYLLISNIPKSEFSATKLNIKNKHDLKIIKNLLKNRLILTSLFSAINFSFITAWHMIYVFPNNIFYLKEDDVIVICTRKNNQLHIWDIIYSKPLNFEKILPKIIPGENITLVDFYFPPDEIQFKYDEIVNDNDSILFVKGDFRLKERYFKFPTTAQT